MKQHLTPVRATYTTDAMRRVQDADTGETRIARMVEERAVQVTLIESGGCVFFRGARIA